MKKILIMALNLIMAVLMLTGCMYDVAGDDNIINPDPEAPIEPIDPNIPASELKFYSGSFGSMNTVISFSMYAPNKNIADRVYSRLKSIYSAYDTVADDGFDSAYGQNYDSELARLNHDRALVNPSKPLVDLITFADLMREETNGYFNPYLGELNHMWKKYIDGIGAAPSQGEMMYFTGIARETSFSYENNVLTLKGEGLVDLGGVAKGYATNKAYEYLKAANVKHFVLNAGSSNIVVGSNLKNEGYNVGISYVFGYPNKTPKLEVKNGTFHVDDIDTKLKSKSNVSLNYGETLTGTPKNGDIFFNTETSEYFVAENGAYRLKGSLSLTNLNVKNLGVCTSNPGQQHKKGDRKAHHLINAFTGKPSNIRDSVTILGVDSGRLDAYSTAIFSMSDEEAISFIKEKGLQGLLVKDDQVYYRTEGL